MKYWSGYKFYIFTQIFIFIPLNISHSSANICDFVLSKNTVIQEIFGCKILESFKRIITVYVHNSNISHNMFKGSHSSLKSPILLFDGSSKPGNGGFITKYRRFSSDLPTLLIFVGELKYIPEYVDNEFSVFELESFVAKEVTKMIEDNFYSSEVKQIVSHFWQRRIFPSALLLVDTVERSTTVVFPYSLRWLVKIINNGSEICNDVFSLLKNYWKEVRNFGNVVRVGMHPLPPKSFYIEERRKVNNKSSNGAPAEEEPIGTAITLLFAALKGIGTRPVAFPNPDLSMLGTRLPNGTLTGVLKSIVNGDLDTVANPRYMLFERSEKLFFLRPHDRDNYCLVVRKAPQMPLYMNFVLPFSPTTWEILLSSLVGTTIVWNLSGVVGSSAPMLIRKNVVRSGDEMFRVFVTGSLGRPVNHDFVLRLIFTVTVMKSLIILNTFQGSLTSYLAVPKFERDLRTLDEVERAAKWIHIMPGFRSSYEKNDSSDVMAKLVRKYVVTYVADDWNNAFKQLARVGGYASVSDESLGRYLSRRSAYSVDGRQPFHMVEQCVMGPAYVSFVTRRSWPLAPALSRAVQLLVEAGVKEQAKVITEHVLTLVAEYVPPLQSSRRSPVILGVNHLQAGFFILLCGYILSCIVFIIEIISKWKCFTRK